MPARSPALRTRLLIAIAIGLASAALCFHELSPPGFYGDFYYPWFAARALAAGHSPYLAIPGGGAYPLLSPFAYPLVAVLAVLPLSWLPYAVAGAVFFGISAALLAFAITRDGYARLPLFASAPFLLAALQGQWSPLVTAVALLPAVGGLIILKPNIGLALFAYRPTRWHVIEGAVIVLVSLVVQPNWPAEWLRNVSRLAYHPSPLAMPVAWLGLVALVRWRRPEARLFVVLLCVPQLLFWSDQLPLLLIPRTLRQSLWVTLISLLSIVACHLSAGTGALSPNAAASDSLFRAAPPWVLAGVYLPVLVIILCRPNEGDVPAWMERVGTAAERWLRVGSGAVR